MLCEHKLQASISTAFWSSPKLSWVFLQLDRKQRICFLFLSKNTDEEKEKLLFFDHQDVNSLCLHHHYVNILYQFCVSIKLQKHNSWPISTHILLGLFSKCCYCTWYHRGFINNYSRKAIVFPADKTFLQQWCTCTNSLDSSWRKVDQGKHSFNYEGWKPPTSSRWVRCQILANPCQYCADKMYLC